MFYIKYATRKKKIWGLNSAKVVLVFQNLSGQSKLNREPKKFLMLSLPKAERDLLPNPASFGQIYRKHFLLNWVSMNKSLVDMAAQSHIFGWKLQSQNLWSAIKSYQSTSGRWVN